MLDKDKPFGECGANIYGWKYIQDGKYYSANGIEIDKEGNRVEETIDRVSDDKPVESPVRDDKPKATPKPRGRRKKATSSPSGAKK